MAFTLPLIGPDKVSKTHDFSGKITWRDGVTPRNLTGWVISWVISSFGQTRFTASTTNGRITVPDPTNGEAFVRITAAQLATIPSGTHRYHCIASKDGVTEALIEESQIEIV